MATPITRYSQIAFEQIPFANYPGGGMTAQGPATPFGNIGFNDPGLELGEVKEVTAIYQMYGNEAASDIINVYLAQPGSMVVPTGTISGSGIATTATINIGDDDTTGVGVVSNLNNPTQASTRYAANINVATGQTNPISFAGGAALTDPYVIGATATEQGPLGTGTGTGVAGSWVQAQFVTLGTPVAGKVLVFRLRVIKP